jgi:photosystem II stability/assembly factor-like uncharacterized protein
VQEGAWTSIGAPEYPAGPPRAITQFAADPYSANVLFATNGTSLMKTTNGGCSWDAQLVLDTLPTLDIPLSGANAEIVDIAIPESRFAHSNIYLLVAEKAGPITRPHVVISRDGGGTWAASDSGLPPATGALYGIHVAPDSPQFVYVHAALPTGNEELFASTDGGRQWTRRMALASEGGAIDMAVDPQNSNELWFWGGGGLYHSTNGGAARSFINYVPPGIPVTDVWHGSESASRILAWAAETSSFFASTNGGRTWNIMAPPIVGTALSIAHGPAQWDVLFSMHEGMFQRTAAGWRDISPPSGVDLYDIEVTRTGPPALLGRTPTTIEVLPSIESGVTLSPFEVNPAQVPGGGTPEMTPKEVNLTLKPGEKETVDLDLDLPPLPNPVDVFFLVDTSKSMDATISGLRLGMQQIIDDLAASGLDVQFGVGEFKDYPVPGYGDAQAGDFPYRLDRTIGPPDEQLKAALERLESSGGGALDQPESQLTGLYQAATGDGDPPWVPAGQDAGFRSGALKVIVNITDATFHKEPQHPSPAFDVVANELASKEILQVGLAIYGPNGARGLADLRDMAAATDTYAPEPVDCDGNGSADIAVGQPLVCEILDEDYDGSLNLAPAIVATVKAVTHEVNIELVPTESDELVAKVSPGLLADVNLKEPNQIGFEVTFTCPRSLYGTKNNKVPLQAIIGSRTEAETVATVTCKPPPEPVKKPDPEKALPLLLPPAARAVVALAAPPPPPPPVVEQIPGTQQMAQAQGAMATEEQEQLQVAVVQQRKSFQTMKDEVYEFSAYKEPRTSPLPLYLAATVMGLAYGSIQLARSRARTAFIRNRSR